MRRSTRGLALAFCAGAMAVLFACGDDDAASTPDLPDASDASRGIPPSDAGHRTSDPTDTGAVNEPGLEAGTDSGPPLSTAVTKTKLRGGDVSFVGVITGSAPHVVYYVNAGGGARSLEAVPIAGGTPVVLQSSLGPNDQAFVSGGAVAWYAGTSDGGTSSYPAWQLGTSISFWTPAAGTKSFTTSTYVGFFRASVDGASVAFSVDAVDDSTDVVVTTASAPSIASPQFRGDGQFNELSLFECHLHSEFAGSVFIASYCPAASFLGDRARLATATADAPAVIRISDDDAPNKFWHDSSAWNATGTRIYVQRRDDTGAIVAADATTTLGELGKVSSLYTRMTADGTVVFTADGALKKATYAGTVAVTTLVASGVNGLNWNAVAPDGKTVAFNLVHEDRGTFDYREDVRTIDLTTASPAPVVHAPNATAHLNGFAGGPGGGSHVLFYEPDVDAWRSNAVTGGTPITLSKNASNLEVPPTGDGMLLFLNIDRDFVGSEERADLTYRYVNVATGDTGSDEIHIYVTTAEPRSWLEHTLYYAEKKTDPGIYGLTLP